MRLTLPLLLGACSQDDMLQKFTTPAEQATARGYIDGLRGRDVDAIEKALDPSLMGPQTHATLVKLSHVIPAGQPTSVKLVGAHRLQSPDSLQVNLTYEYQFAGKWYLANCATREIGGRRTIIGISAYLMQQSLETRNAFTLADRGPAQYIILALAIAAVMFTLYALVVCIRTPLRRKWLWVLFILCGFGMVAVNWAEGAWIFTPLTIQLPSASATAELFGPWIVSVSLPLGAILFLVRGKELMVLKGGEG